MPTAAVALAVTATAFMHSMAAAAAAQWASARHGLLLVAGNHVCQGLCFAGQLAGAPTPPACAAHRDLPSKGRTVTGGPCAHR